MRLLLTGILLSVSFNIVQGQKKVIDNGAIAINIDTTSTRQSTSIFHHLNKDTALIEDLTCWMYAKSGTSEFISIQNGINYNDFTAGISKNTTASATVIHKVTQPEIRDHTYLYASSNYNMPEGIETWPGNNSVGNPLASFIDLNQNQLYEPFKGDYPFIRGDQCLLKINHDQGKRSSTKPPMGVDVTQYYFIFPKGGDPLLDNTVGFRWVFQNNSNQTYDSAKIGLHFHGLHHQLNSNYIGTDVTNSAMYVYPSNNTKQEFTSVILLNNIISNSMYYLDEGQANNKNDIPSSEQHFINYLHSRWKDGDTLKLGSTGLDGDSSVSFAFPYTTNPGYSAWSEDVVGNQGGDRNGILTTEITDWKPNQYKILEGAILFSNNIDSFEALYKRHRDLKHIYDLKHFSTTNPINPKEHTRIYPNPASMLNNSINIEGLTMGDQIKVYTLGGKLIYSHVAQKQNITLSEPFNSTGVFLIEIVKQNYRLELHKVLIIK